MIARSIQIQYKHKGQLFVHINIFEKLFAFSILNWKIRVILYKWHHLLTQLRNCMCLSLKPFGVAIAVF